MSNKNNQRLSTFLNWYNDFLSQFKAQFSSNSFDSTNVPSVNSKFEDQKKFSRNDSFSKLNNWIQSPQNKVLYQTNQTNKSEFDLKNPLNFETKKETKSFYTTLKTQNSRSSYKLNESSKQQVISITYEEIGLFPRSFNRVFDRFFKQLFFDVENLVIQEYRFYRYLFLTTVKCVFILIFVPLVVNFCSKNYLVRPITEYYWNSKQPEIFLNSYMQKRAFNELRDFEERIYFESLVVSSPLLCKDSSFCLPPSGITQTNTENFSTIKPLSQSDFLLNEHISDQSLKEKINLQKAEQKKNMLVTNEKQLLPLLFKQVEKNYNNIQANHLVQQIDPYLIKGNSENGESSPIKTSLGPLTNDFENEHPLLKEIQVFQKYYNEYIQKRLQLKTFELALHYNEESIEAITNFFADLISFSTLCLLIRNLEIQINITKSFLLEVFFGLDDSKKSLLILFITDLLVGYHSPNIWELFFSSFFDHYGLPENQTTIFLLVATLPVLLDVLFKYLIFRHLNRASPATVATYHAMIE